jgi:2'-5' RNA ligase
VPPANFHITLAFLGLQDAMRVRLAGRVAAGLTLPPVDLRLDRVGWFPRARVGWLGCDAAPPALVTFQAGLCDELRAAGFGLDERPWTPHLSLYRDMRKPFGKVSLEAIEWPVREFALMRSETFSSGVRYRPIDRWKARLPGLQTGLEAGDRRGDS